MRLVGRALPRAHAVLTWAPEILDAGKLCLERPVCRREFGHNSADVGHVGGQSGIAIGEGKQLPRPLAVALEEEPPWVARAEELATLREAAARTAGTGRTVAVTGEAGVGKTRLVAEFVAEALVGHCAVLYGHCGSEPTVPYEPLVEALAVPDAQEAASQLTEEAQSRLAHVVPEVAAPAKRRAQPDGEELHRLQLFSAVVACLRKLAESSPVVLVLEDLHWAQSSTLALFKFLAIRLAQSEVTIIGTARTPDSGGGQAIRSVLSDLRQRQAIQEVRLHGLGVNEVAALATAWTCRAAPSGFINDLHAYTGGNPFFVRSTLRHLSATHELAGVDGSIRPRLRDAAGHLPVPDDIRELATSLLDRLDKPAATLLRTGAVLGTEFALDEAAAAAELDHPEAVEALDVVTDAGLVRQQDGSPIRVTFTHALIQQALRAAMTPARRALLSLRAAEAIEAEGAPPARSAELAARYAEAMALGTASQTLHHARRAAEEAGRRYAFEEQGESLELALRAIEAGAATDTWTQYDVLMELGAACYRAAQLERSQQAFASAADLAERVGDPERVAQAAHGVGLERYLHRAGAADAASIALLEQGLRAMGDRVHGLAVRLSTALTLERCFLDPLESRRSRIDEAITAARTLGDADAEIEARTVRQVALWSPTYTSDLLAEVPALVSLAHARSRPDLAMHLHSTALGQAVELGRRDEVERHLAGAAGVADRLRTPIQRVRFDALRILVALLDGRLGEAQAAIAVTLPTMSEIEPDTAVQLGLLWQLMLARLRGTLAEVRPQLESFLLEAPHIQVARGLLAEVCAEGGDLNSARMHLDKLAAHDFEDVHEDFVLLSVLCASGRVAAAVNDRGRALRLMALLEPYADRIPLSGVATVGPPVAYTLGILAASLSQTDEAVVYLSGARERAREFGAQPWEAHAALALGRALRRAGRQRTAREPLAAALRMAEAYGGTGIALRAREELSAAGGRRQRRPDEPTLTRAELRVARLAVRGLSNDRIAQELFVTRRTVETHLTHAYAKLAIRSRSQLADALTAYGLGDEPAP